MLLEGSSSVGLAAGHTAEDRKYVPLVRIVSLRILVASLDVQRYSLSRSIYHMPQRTAVNVILITYTQAYEFCPRVALRNGPNCL